MKDQQEIFQEEQRRGFVSRRTTPRTPPLSHVVTRPDGQTIKQTGYWNSVDWHTGEPTRFTRHEATCIARAFKKDNAKAIRFNQWKEKQHV